MKKGLALLLAVLALFSLTACGRSPSPGGQESPLVSETPAADPAPGLTAPTPDAAPSAAEPVPEPAEETASPAAASGGIDVDLTQLSSTMVYSEVCAMLYEPESYLGKTVKMRGSFSAFEVNGNRYFACVVPDATACCEQGLEFSLKGNPRFPEDYPERGSEITVVGVFDLYSEEHDGNTSYYIILRDAELV